MNSTELMERAEKLIEAMGNLAFGYDAKFAAGYMADEIFVVLPELAGTLKRALAVVETQDQALRDYAKHPLVPLPGSTVPSGHDAYRCSVCAALALKAAFDASNAGAEKGVNSGN